MRTLEMEKKTLRMIHNMARSGSTLMCKCLGCMEHVVLLSEIHPLAWNRFNPVKQATQWFGLFTPTEAASMSQGNSIDFATAIQAIDVRCAERGKRLVLRDWAHLDYTGYPFLPQPSYEPLLYRALADVFDIRRVATARDPVAQWQSLVRLGVMQDPLSSGAFGLEKFLAGYRKYAELCVSIGFVRYEDFLASPESEMRKLCGQLDLELDLGFIDKWHEYKTITGDASSSKEIKPPSPRPLDIELRRRFLANADYQRACELLGYARLESV